MNYIIKERKRKINKDVQNERKLKKTHSYTTDM